MHDGFTFEIWDTIEHKKVFLKTPEETYDILALIGSKERYVIKRVFPAKSTGMSNEAVAVVSTDILHEIAGKYVGKDDPVAMVRGQAGLPAMGEILEPFTFPHLVSGWMRGSHNGPIMPVSVADATPSRFDGPPRVIGLGFQLAEGKLVGPWQCRLGLSAATTTYRLSPDGGRRGPISSSWPLGLGSSLRMPNPASTALQAGR